MTRLDVRQFDFAEPKFILHENNASTIRLRNADIVRTRRAPLRVNFDEFAGRKIQLMGDSATRNTDGVEQGQLIEILVQRRRSCVDARGR